MYPSCGVSFQSEPQSWFNGGNKRVVATAQHLDLSLRGNPGQVQQGVPQGTMPGRALLPAWEMGGGEM